MYPSQQNRVNLPISPEARNIAKSLAAAWSAETGHRWTAKAVVEALLDLANEGEIRPIGGVRRVE